MMFKTGDRVEVTGIHRPQTYQVGDTGTVVSINRYKPNLINVKLDGYKIPRFVIEDCELRTK